MLSTFHNFNSIKVRLELTALRVIAAFLLYFNSIKVRLELIQVDTQVNTNLAFQFHKGTIRTAETDQIIMQNGISIP